MKPVVSWLARAGSLSLALMLAACGGPRPAAESPTEGKGLQVITTVLPITLFTLAVAGDCATVTALIPPHQGPHDVQAKPADLAALRQARVLVKNGLEMETFVDKLVASADNPRLVVIDASQGIPTLQAEEDRHGQDQDQDQDHHHDHRHGAVNPHVWLDPLRAVRQVEAIRDGLVRADPGCADGYRRNAAAYAAQLKQLNTEIAAQLQPYRGRAFVASHDFAPYFAERYGLRVDALVDVPEVNPSPVDLQQVAAAVKTSQLKALVSEPQEGNRSFNALAKDLGVKVVVFDPLETATLEASRDPATYLSVMRRNTAHLRQAFGP